MKYAGSRRPTPKNYLDWMFNDLMDESDMTAWVKSLDKYSHLPEDRSDTEVYDIIKHVMYQISHDISHGKFNDVNDYFNWHK